MRRIDELESLRGLMALWVLVGHAIHLLPISESGNLAIRLLKMNGLAVDVFIILSGFVIFYLLESANERYWPFIVRRFLRLYPCYLLCLVVSILMTQGNLDILQSIPWTTERIAVAQTIILTSLDNFWPNIASHIVLLQGAVPPSLIPYGEYAFLGQAWSISLEWQFYLVAPLLFLICKKQRRWALYLLLASVCIAYWGTGFKFGEGWIFRQATYFFIGISSFYIWRADFRLSPIWIMILMPLSITAVYLIVPRWLALGIWTVVFTSLLVVRQEGNRSIEGVICTVLQAKLLRWLGKISYSVYLTHMIIIYATMRVLDGFELSILHYSILLMALSFVGTLGVSDLTYRLVERPAIVFGKGLFRAPSP